MWVEFNTLLLLITHVNGGNRLQGFCRIVKNHIPPCDTYPYTLRAYLRCLLPPQGHLRRHHPLPLHHQQAVGALAVPPAAEALVSLQAGHHAVVSAAGALRRPAELPLFPHAAGGRLVVALPALCFVLSERRRPGAAAGVRLVVALCLQALYVDFKLATGVV